MYMTHANVIYMTIFADKICNYAYKIQPNAASGGQYAGIYFIIEYLKSGKKP